MRTRSLTIFAVVTAVVVLGAGLAVVVRETALERTVVETVLFPGLIDRVNEVAAIEVADEESFRVAREGERWVMPGKAGFPARFDLVRKTLIEVAELKSVEAKTADPERYAKLGLAASDAAEGAGTGITLLGADDAPLAELVVGARARNARDMLYVRRADDSQAWLARSELRPGPRQLDWVETMLLKLPIERVRRVTIRHPDGEVVEFVKENRDDPDFVLSDIPEGAELLSPRSLDTVARALAVLRFEDVVAAADMPAAADGAVVATYESFDGETVTVTQHRHEDEAWARIEAAYDPEAAIPGQEEAEESGEADEEPLDVAAEVADIVALTDRWAFKLPEFKADQLAKRMDALVKVPEPETTGEEPEPE
jgi:hypothetical protein